VRCRRGGRKWNFASRLPGQTHDPYLTYEHLAGIYADGSDFLLGREIAPHG
jgi:hypothetical protein